MAEYIDRDAFIAHIRKDPLFGMVEQYGITGVIKAFPASDVQPVKHGRWISIGHKLSRICSICDCDEPYNFFDDDANVYDWCPHCGAKMDGET